MAAQKGGHMVGLVFIWVLLSLTLGSTLQTEAEREPVRDLRWPKAQLNFLLDDRSLNETESQTIERVLEQLQYSTCIKINKLTSQQANRRYLAESDILNFVYFLKTNLGLSSDRVSLGLSTHGCAGRGRQSIVLTDSAFKWPDIVLSYHVLRTMGLENLTSPENQVRYLYEKEKLQESLSSNQKSKSGEPFEAPYMVYSGNRQYFDEQQLEALKNLYECPSDQKLSPRARTRSDRRSEDAAKADMVDQTAKKIAASLLDDAEHSGASEQIMCGAQEACPSDKNNQDQISPLLLKPDPTQAGNPQLGGADQVRLLTGNTTIETYRLMDGPATNSELLISFEQASQPHPSPITSSQVLRLCSCTCQAMTPPTRPAPPTPSRPTPVSPSTLPLTTPYFTQAPSTTQSSTAVPGPTLTPTHSPPISTPKVTTADPSWTLDPDASELPVPTTYQPSKSTKPPISSSSNSQGTSPAIPTSSSPIMTPSSASTLSTKPPTETWDTDTTTAISPTHGSTSATTEANNNATQPISTVDPGTKSTGPTFKPEPDSSTPGEESTGEPANLGNHCDQVQWVKPNKTVYSSARIVWDVDRANENYFICNNMINGELVPGKTHGFSCKVSNEGKAFELHNFNVLTKPEQVSLAWVERRSPALGRTNLPVVGGYARAGGDPYIISRCLVRDENNDLLTLIGYVNGKGAGWFPFDDIQIECAQYDVLACLG